MRADLQTLEQIDLYLQGKMTAAESSVFESKLLLHPELKTLVEDQQLLMQTVNRKALLAEITVIAGGGGGAWYMNPYVGFGGISLVVGIVAATVYYTGSDEAPVADQTISQHEVIKEKKINIPEENNTLVTVESDTALYEEVSEVNHSKNRKKEVVEKEETDTDDETILNESEIEVDVLTTDNKINKAGKPVTELGDRKMRNKTAAYPKGNMAMQQFVAENMRFPGTAREKKLQGNVKVRFIVNQEGKKSNIESTCINLRDENDKPLNSTQVLLNQKVVKLFEKEAERIIRIMPVWEPATDSQGNSILSTVEVYFNFSLNDGNTVYSFE